MFCASSSHFLKIKVPSHEWICKNIYGIRIDKMIVYLFIFMFHSRHIYLHLMYKTKIYLIYRFLYKIFQKIALKSLLIISFYCAFIMYPAGNLCWGEARFHCAFSLYDYVLCCKSVLYSHDNAMHQSYLYVYHDTMGFWNGLFCVKGKENQKHLAQHILIFIQFDTTSSIETIALIILDLYQKYVSVTFAKQINKS